MKHYHDYMQQNNGKMYTAYGKSNVYERNISIYISNSTQHWYGSCLSRVCSDSEVCQSCAPETSCALESICKFRI